SPPGVRWRAGVRQGISHRPVVWLSFYGVEGEESTGSAGPPAARAPKLGGSLKGDMVRCSAPEGCIKKGNQDIRIFICRLAVLVRTSSPFTAWWQTTGHA